MAACPLGPSCPGARAMGGQQGGLILLCRSMVSNLSNQERKLEEKRILCRKQAALWQAPPLKQVSQKGWTGWTRWTEPLGAAISRVQRAAFGLDRTWTGT